MRGITVSTIIVFFLAGCSSSRENNIDKYFDVTGFINQQVAMLLEKEVQLHKTVQFGDQSETLTITGLDSAQWHKEFRIFKEHDINKPVLLDAYNEDLGMTEQGNRFTSYSLIDSTGSGVLKMEIIYNSADQVSGWSSSFQEENLLYCNFRELTLTTSNEGILEAYQVRGYHKLMFKDTVHYQLEVDISY